MQLEQLGYCTHGARQDDESGSRARYTAHGLWGGCENLLGSSCRKNWLRGTALLLAVSNDSCSDEVAGVLTRLPEI